MNENIKISVIVPVYNAEKYLVRCTDSILNQSHKNIELILVNDGSTDNSLDLCFEIAEKDDRVKVLTKPNGGAASARNLGIKNATGDYLGFCDSDDYLDINMYEILLNIMIKENFLLIDCNSKVYNETGNLIYCDDDSKKLTIYNLEDALKRIFMRSGNVSLCTKLFKYDLIKDIIIEEGKRVEDFYLTILLLIKLDKYVIYNYPFYNYNVNTSSVTHSASGSIYLDAIYFYNKAIDLLRLNNLNFEKEEDYYLLKMLYLLFISSNFSEWKKYKTQMQESKNKLKKMNSKIISNPYLTFKEKFVLKIACISAKLPRLLHLLKNKI